MQSLVIGQLVHQSVRIWWPDDKKHYKGIVATYDPSNVRLLSCYVGYILAG